jgi:DNA-directed RNA polymerase beta subunit
MAKSTLRLQLKITGKGEIPVRCKDLPGVAEARLRHLDSRGLPRVGASLHNGDILVGIARATRFLNKDEEEILSYGLHYAGDDDLWKDDSIIYQGESVIVTEIKTNWLNHVAHRLEDHDHRSNPMCWLQECNDIPADTVIEEIEITIKPDHYGILADKTKDILSRWDKGIISRIEFLARMKNAIDKALNDLNSEIPEEDK